MTSRFLNPFALFTCCCTLLLIIAGASVTSTGSGLAVPDWPLSYGKVFPPMQGGVLFEHGHRLIAGTVGILTFILMCWLWLKENRRWVCWLGTAAFAVVLLQALLGGITVLYGLPQKISIAHAILAQIFFCLVISIALFTSPKWTMTLGEPGEKRWKTEDGKIFFLSLFFTCLIFFQLVLGAAFRHGAGFSFLYLHIVVALAMGWTSFLIFRAVKTATTEIVFLQKFSILLFAFVTIQIFLGLAIALPKFGLGPFWLASFSLLPTILHVGLGALILANSLLMTLISFKFYLPTSEGIFQKMNSISKKRSD